MTLNPNHPSMFSLQDQAELELLQQLLAESINDAHQADAISAYPWNPAEAEHYFAALEQEGAQVGWTNEELVEQGQILANYMEQAWAAFDLAPVAQVSVIQTISARILQNFAAPVPQHILDSIVQHAQQVFASNLSVADQMVQCVQNCLPNWGEEDLQVLARPFAYAMRGGADTEMLEAALRSVRCAAWTELSGVEQARLSLAIARYAIAQMPTETGEHL